MVADQSSAIPPRHLHADWGKYFHENTLRRHLNMAPENIHSAS
jgi:hypothetical protein